MSVSIVIPSYNRRAALERSLPAFLAIRGADELVIVVDGSTDGTADFLRAQDEPRLKVIEQANAGAPAARNAGIKAARGDWLLMADDDCIHAPDHIEIAQREAESTGADLVGAPWINVQDPDVAASWARDKPRIERPNFTTMPYVFPRETVETPFLIGGGGIFVRRTVLDQVDYDSRYTVNAWREETDFVIRANAAGFKSVLTPETYTYQAGDFGGGQRNSTVKYEWAAAVNNWRFLQRNGAALRRMGEIKPPLVEQVTFVCGRLWSVVRGGVMARARRLRSRG